MATQWGFGGLPAGDNSSANAKTTQGEDLEPIDVEQIGFKPVSADRRVRLLPTPWPRDQLPMPTASLMSIASGRGLVAAAGPDALVLATTERIRKAFKGLELKKRGEDESVSKEDLDKEKAAIAGQPKLADFTPELSIPTSRIAHVVFSSDESCLVTSAEQGGGLDVYDVDALLNGSKDPAFQLSTNGQAVRHILPNPAKESSQMFAIVLADGNLVLADLKQNTLVTGANGSTTFKDDVSCASWSKLGKALVAGLSAGGAVQMDLQGNVKAEIPRPPQLDDNVEAGTIAMPMTGIYWLETFEFLTIHSPINPPAGQTEDLPPSDNSVIHIVHREKTGHCTYSRFSFDPTPAFLDERLPAHHFIQRLRDWPPDLEDVLVLCSTLSTDLGMLTKSRVSLHQPETELVNGEVKPVGGDIPTEKLVNVYTTTTPKLDERRAILPTSNLHDEGIDPSVIGMALDLSSTENVWQPIAMDKEIDYSPHPLPVICALNYEGVLSAWDIVYNKSIRDNAVFSGIKALEGNRQPAKFAQSQASNASAGSSTPAPAEAPKPASTPSQPARPAFGQSSTPAFGQPSGSGFGQGSSPAFGQPSKPAFGGNSTLGQSASPWGAPPAKPALQESPSAQKSTFGQPSSGVTAFGTPNAFGQTGGIGAKASPWGTSGQTSSAPKSSGSVFGQAGGTFGGNSSLQSPFASFGKPAGGDASKPAASPFSSFGSVAQNNGQPSPSPFSTAGQKQPGMPVDPSFGSTVTLNSSTGSFGSGGTFGQASGFGSFGKPSQGVNGQGSAFGKPAEENAKPSPFRGFKLGSTFSGDGSAKDDLPTPKDAGAGLFGSGFGNALGETTTKPEAEEPPKTLFGGDSSSGRGLGQSAKTDTKEPPKSLFGGNTFGGGFGQNAKAESKEPPKSLFGGGSGSGFGFGQPTKQPEPTTPIKPEPGTEEAKLNDIPEFSTTPASPPKQQKSQPEAAPMPPDFLSAKPKKDEAPPPSIPDDAPLPPDPTIKSMKDEDEGLDVPIAGSPPLDVGDEKFSESSGSPGEEAGPLEDDDEPDWSDEEGDDDSQAQGDDEEGVEEEEDDEDDEDDEEVEGDEDDEEEEGDEEDGDEEEEKPYVVKDPQGLAAFKARMGPASPKRNQPPHNSTTPETLKKPSYTPAGLPPNLQFPPPMRPQESPSPVRAASSPMRFGQTARQPPAPAPQFGKMSVPPGQPVERPSSRQKAPTPQPAPEPIDLEDEEDARIKAILDAPVEPNKDVPEFIAHRPYIGGTDKPGIAGQMEKVYRDVNSMIDTLGLNARALQAFVDGHKQVRDASSPRTRNDLEDEEAWVFEESDELRSLIKAIDNGLEKGRLDDVPSKLEDIEEEDKKLLLLRNKTADFRKQIATHADPEHRAAQHNAPLPPETAVQQSELRQGVQQLQKQLAQAEEAMGLLRADLASLPTTTSTATSNAPTVEAVTNTILKMTAMVSKRSGDIDVLESQIRRLPGGLASLKLSDDYEDELADVLRGSKFSAGANGSPRPTTRARMTATGEPLGMSGMLGGSRFLRHSMGGGASALGQSTVSLGASARKRMGDVGAEEVEGWRRREGRRKRVLAGLRERVEERGVRVVGVEK